MLFHATSEGRSRCECGGGSRAAAVEQKARRQCASGTKAALGPCVVLHGEDTRGVSRCGGSPAASTARGDRACAVTLARTTKQWPPRGFATLATTRQWTYAQAAPTPRWDLVVLHGEGGFPSRLDGRVEPFAGGPLGESLAPPGKGAEITRWVSRSLIRRRHWSNPQIRERLPAPRVPSLAAGIVT